MNFFVSLFFVFIFLGQSMNIFFGVTWRGLILFIQGLFTWSGRPRSSGVGFFCFHALGDTKQKKPTPLDRVSPTPCKQGLSFSLHEYHIQKFSFCTSPSPSPMKFFIVRGPLPSLSTLLIKTCFFNVNHNDMFLQAKYLRIKFTGKFPTHLHLYTHGTIGKLQK